MIWKKIDNYDYEVSFCGSVRSIEKTIIRSDGKPHFVKSKILRPANDQGYLKVALSGNGKLKSFRVHRLVAKAFCGCINGKYEVNHIDGNKLNNRADNLEWCNRSENVKHAFNNSLAKPLRGSKNPTSVIDEIKAMTIKTMLMSGFGPTEISKRYGVSINICKDISRGRTWNHIF